MRWVVLIFIFCGACAHPSHHVKHPVAADTTQVKTDSTLHTTTKKQDHSSHHQKNTSTQKLNKHSTPIAPPQKTSKQTDCNPDLWNHVYNPERLKVIDDCITISGTVLSVKHEADGDDHIQLKPDAQFLYMLNEKNYSGQAGCLVVEIICINKVTQSDATSACVNYNAYITEPHAGDKVQVTGAYVLDIHHGWNEIHPVSALTITGKSSMENFDNNPVVGYTRSGQKIYLGPKGGRYHYSASGNKVYEK